MTDLEEELRRRLPEHAVGQSASNPGRASAVRRRVVRDRRRRVTLVAGAAVLAVASGVAVVSGGGLDRAGDGVDPAHGRGDSGLHEILQGATLPPDFDEAVLAPLADEARVPQVEGAAQAVTCAWVSRWRSAELRALAEDAAAAAERLSQETATSPSSPTSAGPASVNAAEILAVLRGSADWVMLQAIAEDTDYPRQVALIVAQLDLDQLSPDWQATLGCDRFPGNSNLDDGTR